MSTAEPMQLEVLLTLMDEFGRIKLNLQDITPQWSRRMHQQLQAAGMKLADGEEQIGLLRQFHRAYRLLGSAEAGVRMSEVSERLGIPLSSASRTVEQLVQRGLLTRRPDQHDRRMVLVSVTPLGQTVFDIFDAAFRRHLGDLLGQLSIEERGQLLHLGQRLFAIWSAAVHDDSGTPLP
ncbi:MarR family winged helix-turn-helix transcriptional regulator [Deinococcus alpinitundrae]|uniref:MarR family winged helix-turn-helix transcriptional regulator n=1 Tax=Deinococcus alpinitundrae TaxID=468913 RepID=UPI00137985A6|nr:MarR family transcriptional regulator [Deinococcus alpinitundrae]